MIGTDDGKIDRTVCAWRRPCSGPRTWVHWKFDTTASITCFNSRSHIDTAVTFGCINQNWISCKFQGTKLPHSRFMGSFYSQNPNFGSFLANCTNSSSVSSNGLTLFSRLGLKQRDSVIGSGFLGSHSHQSWFCGSFSPKTHLLMHHQICELWAQTYKQTKPVHKIWLCWAQLTSQHVIYTTTTFQTKCWIFQQGVSWAPKIDLVGHCCTSSLHQINCNYYYHSVNFIWNQQFLIKILYYLYWKYKTM